MFKRSRKGLAMLLSASILAGTMFTGGAAVQADPVAIPGTPYDENGNYDVTVPHVVINQIFGGGLKTANDVYFSHGFIELYNPTNTNIDLSGWSLQYADRGDNSTTGATLPWVKLDLEGEIQAHSSFLVLGAKLTDTPLNPANVLTGDQTWTADPPRFINNKGLKVALMSNQTLLQDVNPFVAKTPGYVDMLGTGSNDSGSNIDSYETDYPTGSAEGTSKKKSIRRVNFIDTDNNKQDFVQVDYEALASKPLEQAQVMPRTSASGPWYAPLGLRNTELPAAQANMPYVYSVRGLVYGGTSPHDIAVTGLPANLVYGNGKITGVPAEIGLYPIYVSVTDSNSVTASVYYNLQVSQALDTLQIVTTALPQAKIGQPYSAPVEVTGGNAPLAFSAAGLPQGLTIDPATGVISGTLADDRAVTVMATITVTDSAVYSRSITLPLSVQPEAKTYEEKLKISKIASYAVGTTNEDGGVAEIVKYNKENGKFYLVNGSANPPTLDVVTLASNGTLTKDKSVNVKQLSEQGGSFDYGDLTSVDVNPALLSIFVSVQEADYTKPGKILRLDYNGNLLEAYGAGVQPDMIKSTHDGKYVLTADEGEPRMGNGPGAVDPKGSITIVDTATGESVQVEFDDPDVIDDDVIIRSPNVDGKGQIVEAGTKADAVHDFEPEYIALSADSKTAYVTLQENNAIATIDIARKKVLSVKSLGHKDLSDPNNVLDLLVDGQIKLENVPFKGVYMPDGLAAHEIGGKTYLFTANEGDATEWPVVKPYTRSSLTKIGSIKDQLTAGSEAAKFLQDKGTLYDGVEVLSHLGNDDVYMLGGRSFSIWEAGTLEQVYDSGSDFERITSSGQYAPYFNAGHVNLDLDSRSSKKGPEPEDIKTGRVGARTLAFIGLERIGGIMTYDVSDPAHAFFANYTNTRNLGASNKSEILATDTGPEGIEFIPAADSPTGLPLLLVAFEVSGTVAVYQLDVSKVTLDKQTVSLSVGGASAKITATVAPAEGAAATVTWSSSNTAVAIVDASGNVTPRAAGTAVVTALSADGFAEAKSTVTVTAGSTNPGSGGGTGGGTTPPATSQPEPQPSQPPVSTGDTTKATVEAKAETNASGAAEAVFTLDAIAESLEALQKAGAGQTVELQLKASEVGQAGEAIVRVPADAWSRVTGSGVTAVTVDAGIGSVSFGRTAIAAISEAGGEVAVTVKKLTAEALAAQAPQASQAAITAALAGKPVFDLTVTAGGKTVSSFGGGSVEVVVPYAPTAGEDVHAIVIYYISDSGELVVVPNSAYDPATGTVKFSVNHFSNYAVGYRKVSFADTASNFAANEITYLAARNILTGVGESKFSPAAKLTRGDLAVILARMTGADVGGYSSSGFIDVESGAYYAKAIAWAADTGIAGGVGQGLYKPKDYVTREQLVTLIARYAEHMDYKLPKTTAAITFADQQQVSSFAAGALRSVQQAGLINGKPSPSGAGSLFAPKAHATRAETAKILAQLMQAMLK